MIHLVEYKIKPDAQIIKTDYFNKNGCHITDSELSHIIEKKQQYGYFTIWEYDKLEFLLAINDFNEDGDFCKIIYDNDKKQSIIKSYLSKNRGEQYDENKTSVSVITGKLYPINIKKDIGLINNYYKKLTIERKENQDKVNEEAFSKGNDIHLVLERWLNDKRHFSLKRVEDFIDEKISNPELVIEALTKYPKYKDKASKNYLVDQLSKTDCVYSEIFVSDKNIGIQGCVDALLYTKKGLVLKDYKTTSSTDSSGKPKTKSISMLDNYYRQMLLYGYMLTTQGYITKKEFKNLIYNNDMFYFLRNEYREYYYDTTNIKDDLKNIIKVVQWFTSYTK